MRPEDMVRRFLEECMRHGLVFAIRRFQQRLPFCTDIDLLGDELGNWVAEIRRLRRICHTIIFVAVTGVAASLPVLLNDAISDYLRIFCCLIASAGIVMAMNFFRHLPRLKPEPLLVALEYSRIYLQKTEPEA
jgi:hypothetical protein